MSSENEDLSVNGPGSPLSLRKIIKSIKHQQPEKEHLPQVTMLIDNAIGIVKDDPDTIVITPDDCKMQAMHFLKTVFDGVRIPYYTIRHLLACYERQPYSYSDDPAARTKLKYPDNESVKMAVMTGAITKDDEDYKFLLNKFTYGEHDPEFLQLLGLIQLVAGSVKSGRRIFIDYPETFLHPKRERIVMSMMNEIYYDEYLRRKTTQATV